MIKGLKDKRNQLVAELEMMVTAIEGETRALTTEEEAMTASDLYERLYNLSPKNLYDPNMGQGLSYYEWIGNQLKDTESDTAWRDWLFYSGGYQDFINAVKQRGKTEARKTFDKKIADKEAEEAAKQKVLNKAAKAYETTMKELQNKKIYL